MTPRSSVKNQNTKQRNKTNKQKHNQNPPSSQEAQKQDEGLVPLLCLPVQTTQEGQRLLQCQPEPCRCCLPWALELRHLEGLLAGLELIPLLGLDHNYSNFLTELGSRTV